MARIKLLTFNVAHARGVTPIHQGLRSHDRIRKNLLKIAHLIDRVGADVVAIQEIDQHSAWNGSFDHLAYLAEHCSLKNRAIGLTNKRAGRFPLNYGNAVLSRWPIVHEECSAFGQRPMGEKGFLFVEADLGHGRRLPLVNLHLHHSSRAQRLIQAKRMMQFIDQQRAHRAAHWATPMILCGDLNNPAARPDATAMLLGYFEQDNNYTLLPKTGRTFPSALPARALDYVLLPSQCEVAHAEILRAYLSDHRPVLVEFQIKGTVPPPAPA